jgi:hypothetical protein
MSIALPASGRSSVTEATDPFRLTRTASASLAIADLPELAGAFQDSPRLLQMWRVDHLAVQLKGTGAWIGREGIEDGLGIPYGVVAGRERSVDDGLCVGWMAIMPMKPSACARSA